MHAFQQRLFEFSARNFFLLKPDAPKTNNAPKMPFMSKMLSTLNLFCLTQCTMPKMDAFMKDVLNVKPVLLKQNELEMDAFQQRLFEFSA